MTQPTATDIVVGVVIAAVVIPIVTLMSLWCARRISRWFMSTVSRAFAQIVVDVMAPDMARLGIRLGTSIDELKVANASEHTEVQGRLGGVESRLHEVEVRLAAVESRLPKEHFPDA